MTAIVDKRGVYHNRTDESDWNRGNNGKLNPDQLRERAVLHAKRLVFGKPTLQEIAEHWQTAYGISMHYNSEKEWGWRNEDTIEAVLNEMIESGEIKDPGLSETSLITTINKSGKETAKVIRELEKSLVSALRSVDLDGDYLAACGITPEEYDNSDGDLRKKFDTMIKREKDKNNFRLEAAVQYSKMLKDHKTVLIETIGAAKDLFDDSRLKQIKNDKLIEKKVGDLIGNKDASEFSGGIEVTDDMREKLLGVN